MTDTIAGADGRLRCGWAASAPEYEAYHDTEWGRPVTSESGLFERLSLEAFQAGLSWITILRKREAFRAAFHGFDPAKVATYGDADVTRLLLDAGIVRNRAKILAVIANARALQALPQGETLGSLLAQHRTRTGSAPVTLADVPASTPASTAFATALRARGFSFVGPVSAYAMMQATGTVNDHLADCWIRNDC